MNFKIENIILNITNYPSVAEHLEDMASKGWILSKILWSHIFIYKRIEPRALDFSIYPYKNESILNKMSRKDLDYMRKKNQALGWTYSAKANNFQVYFKEKDEEAQDMIASEKEELRVLEGISKTLNVGIYFLLAISLLLLGFFGKNILNSIEFLKSGVTQILVLLLPLLALTSLIDLISMNKFLKKNRHNIDKGESLEYRSSKFYFHKISFLLSYLFMISVLVYVLYTVSSSKDYSILTSMIPVTVGLLAGSGYRFFIKPSKRFEDYKIIILVGVFIGVIVFINLVMPPIFMSEDERWNTREEIDLKGDRVLEINDFIDKSEKNQVRFSRDISFLIPKSYEYINRSGTRYEGEYVTTDYLKSLTESIAATVVNRYIGEAEDEIDMWTDYMLENYYYDGVYMDRLGEFGVSNDELLEMKKKDIDTYKENARALMKERAIVDADHKLWKVDEAYFLDYNKDEILLRKNKEVYVLYGMDFSQNENRKIAMDKLGI